MTFATPAALWALTLLAPLAAMYILHFRRRPVEVGSLMLWAGLKAPSATGRKLHRLQTPLSLLLEALIFIALALLAAGPVIAANTRAPLTIILDDSMSMSARTADTTAVERGLDAVEQAIAEADPDRVTLILAGPTPEVAATAITPALARDAAQNAWTAARGDADLPAAIELASTIADRNTRILVLSDRAPLESERLGQARWIAVGTPESNASIVAAVRTADRPGSDAIVLDIANWSTDARDVAVQFNAESTPWTGADNTADAGLASLRPIGERTVRIDAAGTTTVRLRIDQTDRAVVATLGPDTVLADNRVVLVPVRSPAVRVRIDAQNDRSAEVLRRAAAATGRARVVEVTPELVLTDRADAAPLEPWFVAFRAPGPGVSPATGLGPFTLDRSTPLAEGLELDGVRWTHEPGWVPDAGEPWVYLGREPVAFSDRDSNGQRVIFNVDLARGSFAESSALPVIVWNALAVRTAARPGPSLRNTPAESVVPVGLGGIPGRHIPPGAEPMDLPAVAASVDVPVRAPGIHIFEVDGRRYRAAVNPTFEREGDLRAAAPTDTGAWLARDEHADDASAGRPLGVLFGVLAAILAVAHAVLLWSGKRGGG